MLKRIKNNRLFFLRISLILCFINLILLSWIVAGFLQIIKPEKKFHFQIADILIANLLKKENTKHHMKQMVVLNLSKINHQLFLNKNYVTRKLESNNFEILELKVGSKSLNNLNSSLPISGKKYEVAELKIDNDWQEVKIKYRGDHYYHWAFDKKSINIKTKKGETFHLINPKQENFIADKIAYLIAREQYNLVAPDTKWTGLFINDQFQGIYLQVENINDDFALSGGFDSIIEGEKITFSDSSGHPLFKDYKKWSVEAGVNNLLPIADFLTNINTQNSQSVLDQFDVDYLARFYSFVSLLKNESRNASHNWLLGIKNERLYPLVWDPIAWIQAAKGGNRIEEMVSPLSSLLRKNIYFNQKFVETLWQSLSSNFINDIDNLIKKEREALLPVLDLDYLKGGSHHNPDGTRAIQSTQDIDRAVDKLKTTIRERIDFLQQELAKTGAKIYQQNGYLYIGYDGLAGSYLKSSSPLIEVEVFNQGEFKSLKKNQLGNLIYGGRTKESENPLPYAIGCQMIYRIPLTPNLINNLSLTHSLTGERIDLVEAGSFPFNECNMDFSLISSDSKNLNKKYYVDKNLIKFKIKTSNFSVSDLTNFYEKINENIQLKIDDQNLETKIEKDKFSLKIKLKLDELWQHHQKYLLIPEEEFDFKSLEKLINPDISLFGFLKSITEVSLEANNFELGNYYLLPKLDKPLIELSSLSWDTDIFEKKKFDTLNRESFEKVSYGFNGSEEDHSKLKTLFELINNNKNVSSKIDLNNLIKVVNFMFLSGNENIGYALYFDQTSGKIKIFPLEFSFYNSNSWSIKDPLINSIIDNLISHQVLEQNNNNFQIKNDASNEKTCKLDSDYLTKFIVDNQITIPANTRLDINETVSIPNNCKTLIHSGVKINIAPKESLIFYGKVTAMGDEDSPIEVNSQNDSEPFGSFSLVNEGANGSNFNYFHIKNGSESFINDTYFSGMFSAYHADDVVVRNSTFKNAQADDALNFKYSNSSVYDSLFEDNSADAIDFDFMSGEISGNTFINNGNDSIDTSGSTTLVRNNYIKDSGDKCISVGEKSYLTITNNVLDGCDIGIETKDESEPVITHTLFKNNIIALNAYLKKDFFGSAYPKIYNSLFIDNDENLTLRNSFIGEKLSSDDSHIRVVNSLFDHLSDKELLEQNKEIDDLNEINQGSLSNSYFPKINLDRPQYLIDNVIGLVYPDQVPQL